MAIRLYVKQKTKAHDAASDHLRLYGLKPDLKHDDRGTYFDVTPPDYWNKDRQAQFQAGLDRLEWL